MGSSKSKTPPNPANAGLDSHQGTPEVPELPKVLILGTMWSGKSTIYRQLRMAYSPEYNSTKILTAERDRVVQGFFMALEDFLKSIVAYYGDLGNPAWDRLYHDLYRHARDGALTRKQKFSPEIIQFVNDVWTSNRGQELWANRFTLSQVPECLEYFVGAMDRMAEEDYVPTEDDVLMNRITTTGVHKQTIEYNNVSWNLVDVGGARAERRKWIRCFSDVKAVLFVVDVSEFDQKLFEAGTIDRDKESKDLFRKVLSFKFLMNTPFLLFLNKHDLLVQKLNSMEEEEKDLDDYFPHLKLGNNYENAANIILNDLKQEYESMCPRGRIHATVSTAISTSSFKEVFETLAYSILSEDIEHYIVEDGDANDFILDPGVEQGYNPF